MMMDKRGKVKKNEIGLVFCGGGARGAYEIGAWKAIREAGLEKFITGVAGTSIGACNTALFINGDYDRALEVWDTVEQMDLTYPSVKSALSEIEKNYGIKNGVLEAFYSAMEVAHSDGSFSHSDIIPAFSAFKDSIAETYDHAKKIYAKNKEKNDKDKTNQETKSLAEHMQDFKDGFADIKNTLASRDNSGVDMEAKVYDLFYTYLNTPLFSQDGLAKIIDDKIWLDNPDYDNYNIFSTVTLLESGGKPMYVNWRNRSAAELKNLILASASIPLAFNKRLVDGKECVDGGLADNRPIRPLYDLGYRRFIVINLRNEEDESLIREMGQVAIDFADSEIISITPGPDFNDGAYSALRLTKELTHDRIMQGYTDAKRVLAKQLGSNRKSWIKKRLF